MSLQTAMLLQATLQALYPDMAAEEAASGATNLIAYLDFVNGAYDRLRSGASSYASFKKLTSFAAGGTVEAGPVEPLSHQPQTHS